MKVYFHEELDMLVIVRKSFNNEATVIEKGNSPEDDWWYTPNTAEFYGFEYIGEL